MFYLCEVNGTLGLMNVKYTKISNALLCSGSNANNKSLREILVVRRWMSGNLESRVTAKA